MVKRSVSGLFCCHNNCMTTPSLPSSGLPRLEERRTFGYFEHARLHVEGSTLTVITEDGRSPVPVTMFSCVFLGSGCSLTTEAATLLSDSGVPVAWVRDGMVRLLSGSRPLASTSYAAQEQARLWAADATRLSVVRRMYAMRFGKSFVRDTTSTVAGLQAQEGARVKERYRELASTYGVPWSRRDNKEMRSDDPVNAALSIAHGMYHGLASCVIFGLGYIPQLGFIHIKSPISFALDIADIYKSAYADEAVFKMFSEVPELITSPDAVELGREVRRRIRMQIVDDRLMQRLIDTTTRVLDLDPYSEWNLSDEGRDSWWNPNA